MTTRTFNISGMHCASCAATINEDLEDIAGVTSATTDFDTGTSVVEVDNSVSNDQIVSVIVAAGYKAEVVNE